MCIRDRLNIKRVIIPIFAFFSISWISIYALASVENQFREKVLKTQVGKIIKESTDFVFKDIFEIFLENKKRGGKNESDTEFGNVENSSFYRELSKIPLENTLSVSYINLKEGSKARVGIDSYARNLTGYDSKDLKREILETSNLMPIGCDKKCLEKNLDNLFSGGELLYVKSFNLEENKSVIDLNKDIVDFCGVLGSLDLEYGFLVAEEYRRLVNCPTLLLITTQKSLLTSAQKFIWITIAT